MNEGRDSNTMLTEGGRVMQKLRSFMREVHNRVQKNDFKRKINNIAKIQPALLDMIYQELALDASVTNHPVTTERTRAMFLGAEGLIADLRHLNPGRPGNRYDVFFNHMEEMIEESFVAADDRRHGASHMSQWLSIKDLIKKTSSRSPEGTPIPSKDLVRLQFIPKNPYTRTALNFTSRLQVQHKIQRRQLRAAHPDDHYCAALFKYYRNRAVEENERAMLFCCDDKAKVHVGEPDVPVSTGVRGRESITHKSITLEALDHDMHKTSLTPNVVLKCEVPATVDKSFVRGNVHYTVSDSVFQSSSPYRHGVMLAKIVKNLDDPPSILMKFTDGGTDQRNTLESVKVASICLFKELNLDFMIAARCAPGHSFMNPAERIMSILNLGLQNVATERTRLVDASIEKKVKNCNSMAELRALNEKDGGIKDAWLHSIKEAQTIISERFSWLSLKDTPFQNVDVVTDEEIEKLQAHELKLFPGMSMNKLQKVHARQIASYVAWKLKHCKEEHYALQIKKCTDPDCCTPSKLPRTELNCLPMPILDGSGAHYVPYEEAKGMKNADGRDRPSLKVQKVKEPKGAKAPQSSGNISSFFSPASNSGPSEQTTAPTPPTPSPPAIPMTAQTARAVIVCVECEKPRVIYSKTKLNNNQRILLAKTMSSYEYSCGSYLFPPSEKAKTAKTLCIRPSLQCAMQIEVPFYGSEVGRADKCSHCGGNNGVRNPELTKNFKTVLPVCKSCLAEGKKPFTQRPYGKPAAKN